MLLDKYLPKFDFTEVHTTKINATPDTAYQVMMEITEAEVSPIVRILTFLSELPDKIKKTNERTMKTDIYQPMLDQMMQNGFTRIEGQGREIVFGLVVSGSIGAVWKKSSVKRVIPANAEKFFAFKDPAYLWVVANFMVKESGPPGIVTIYTESRTMALSEKSRKSFRPYWAFIRPWSGLIRRMILRAIKRRAERQAV
jgi:hypothetical protein